ncbi:MAG: hypothetical protein K8S87_05665 [Planctomycetes bacterium]|nr:hypothetical protein [Planctomycetota bacterium]
MSENCWNLVFALIASIGVIVALMQLCKANKTFSLNVMQNLDLELVKQSNAILEAFKTLETLNSKSEDYVKKAIQDEIIGKMENYGNIAERLLINLDKRILKSRDVKSAFWANSFRTILWGKFKIIIGTDSFEKKFPALTKYCKKWEKEDKESVNQTPNTSKKEPPTFNSADIFSLVGY